MTPLQSTPRISYRRVTIYTLTIVTAVIRGVPGASAESGFSYADLNTVLFKYVSPVGLVDYKGIVADPAALNTFLASVGKDSPESDPSLFPTHADQLTYYINAYNAFAIQGVTARPGIRTVDSVKQAFFVGTTYLHGGRAINLQDLEDKVRGYGDPRVHFALNCQSVGCPRLPNTAFDAGKLDTQLDGYTREFVTNPKQVSVDSAGVVHLSHLFDWYSKDFATSGGAVAFINTHGGSIPATAKIEWVPYDWTLSAQPGRNP